jgi:glycosyltransferase involved in cell wall biosynthesis
LASFFKRLKIIVNVHGSDVFPENKMQNLYQVFTKKILNISDKIVVPSEYFKLAVLEKYSLRNKTFFVYPSGGVSNDVFFKFNKVQIDSVKEKYKINKSKIIFGFVGRLIHSKGWKTFLLAAKEVINKNSNIFFVVIGSGPDQKDLAKFIFDNHFEDFFLLLPFQNQFNLCELYNTMDLFIFPTERLGESLGLVAVEALTCGIPVIASDIAAPKFYITNNYNGFKFPVGDYITLSNLMLESVNDLKLISLKNGALESSKIFNTNNSRLILKKIFFEI